jgi:hypothetical protein
MILMNYRSIVMTGLVVMTLSASVEASPWSFIKQTCSDVMGKLSTSPQQEHRGASYVPPENSHQSHVKTLDEYRSSEAYTEQYHHLPELEQSLDRFKDTNLPFIRYFFDNQIKRNRSYRDFLNSSVEVIYFPHSSYHGHVRLRIGERMYGFESVKRTFNGSFDTDRIFKSERRLKKGKKAGNEGVVYLLTEDQQAILQQRQAQIKQFYDSSQMYNIPPFDGSGASEVKVIVDEATGKISYHSPTSPSSYGNRAEVNGELVEIEGKEFLKSPNGYLHPVRLNAAGERVTHAYSCTSSASHVLSQILGLNVKEDMPYAGSFMTHLKNGAEGAASPSALIHYYPSSDL